VRPGAAAPTPTEDVTDLQASGSGRVPLWLALVGIAAAAAVPFAWRYDNRPPAHQGRRGDALPAPGLLEAPPAASTTWAPSREQVPARDAVRPPDPGPVPELREWTNPRAAERQADARLRATLARRLEQSDWAGVEQAAREYLQRFPEDGGAVRALAYALVRLDRSGEARALLEGFLERHPDDANATALLARIRRDGAAEAGLRQQNLSHFHVRYDGEAHEDVGREVLRVLERHYASLAITFDHQPADTIPVLLLSRETYYETSDAPAWAGGHFDSFDGRVRIPIGGLTTSLTPQLDGTVLHELTHAFVADRSAGLAPRELHEGLAQWMEGDRVDDKSMRALVQGRFGAVHGFYLASLALVEDLLRQRGQGSINEVLSEMAATRDVDEAFRRVYGDDLRTLSNAAQRRWRQQYGG
jgi:hypothetical protein